MKVTLGVALDKIIFERISVPSFRRTPSTPFFPIRISSTSYKRKEQNSCLITHSFYVISCFPLSNFVSEYRARPRSNWFCHCSWNCSHSLKEEKIEKKWRNNKRGLQSLRYLYKIKHTAFWIRPSTLFAFNATHNVMK